MNFASNFILSGDFSTAHELPLLSYSQQRYTIINLKLDIIYENQFVIIRI